MKTNKQIFISNRLPFGIDKNSGELKRSSGGLVSALLGVNLDEPFHWLGFETNPLVADILIKQAFQIQPNLILGPVLIDANLYDDYYDKFCNDTLWPLFHYEGQHTFFQREYWEAFVAANKIMAEAVLNIANDDDHVWVHDFHFFLLPKLIKDKNPNIKVGVFLHTPFPSSEIYRQLPVREELLNHVIHADLLGFHEHSYLRHFSNSMKATLGVDSTFFKAVIGNHTLNLGVYPISIDSDRLKKLCHTPEVVEQTAKFQESISSEFLILGVDRLDYSKGLKLKLKGFRRTLQKYPQLQGKVKLLQIAIPTRVNVPSYINLKNEIDKLVGEINGEFGRPDYTPVNYIYNSVTETELIALYKRAQGILITSKRDGMNLVAMEYSICQDEMSPGVLILSEFTGAASLLGHGLIINPWDVDSTADAIYSAFNMPLEEKKERVLGLQAILNKYSASTWAETFLNDLNHTFDSVERSQTIEIGPEFYRWPSEIKNSFSTGCKTKIFLDYDGTLVGFKSKPSEAIMSNSTRALLNSLSEKAMLIIVSGRSRDFLDEQFKDMNVDLVAEHGAFYKPIGAAWSSRLITDTNIWYPEVLRVMKSYTDKVPLSLMEVKSSSIVWHYRQSPKDFGLFQARKLDDELQACLSNLPVSVSMGAKIVEAKAIECNKGDFIKWHISNDKDDVSYVCIGDDKTDEDMFQVLKDKGLTIKVGIEASSAHYSLKHQTDVIPFLEGMVNQL